jgi:exodeoxyribonuclease-3
MRHPRCLTRRDAPPGRPSRPRAWRRRGPKLAELGVVARRPPGYCSRVRLATWNVNSVKQRVPRLLPWLDQRQPDVVCLQETKLADDAFTSLLGGELASRGYQVAVHGEARWNGVAIVSRAGLDDVAAGIDKAPGFPHPEARAIAATCAGIRVHSVYVPNGRSPGSEHYQYKLAWLDALRESLAGGPESVIVCGDMNIAPADADVFDPQAYLGQTHVTRPERAALARLQALGLRDIVRDRWPAGRVFTYWDYRAGMFHQDLGMRIDLVLASAAVAGRVRAAWVDRYARKGTGPSDHAPVIVDLDQAPDGDIGPVVPRRARASCRRRREEDRARGPASGRGLPAVRRIPDLVPRDRRAGGTRRVPAAVPARRPRRHLASPGALPGTGRRPPGHLLRPARVRQLRRQRAA